MYKFLIRIVFSLCLLPSVGYSMMPPISEASGIQELISVTQELSTEVILSSGNVDREVHSLNSSFYYLELSFQAIAIEGEESEEEVHSIHLVRVARDFRVSNFIDAFLFENILWKINYRAFADSLNLFSKSARTHLVLQIFNI